MQTTQRPSACARLDYYLPRRVYGHFCLWQGMRRLGFSVLYVVKLDHHHVCDMRLRACAKISDKAVRRLRRELRKLCAEHGHPIKAGKLSIVRDGCVLELAFIWPVGEAGDSTGADLQQRSSARLTAGQTEGQR